MRTHKLYVLSRSTSWIRIFFKMNMDDSHNEHSIFVINLESLCTEHNSEQLLAAARVKRRRHCYKQSNKNIRINATTKKTNTKLNLHRNQQQQQPYRINRLTWFCKHLWASWSQAWWWRIWTFLVILEQCRVRAVSVKTKTWNTYRWLFEQHCCLAALT